MKYIIKNVSINFDETGKMQSIDCTAEMPFNSSDVRTMRALRSNCYWNPIFQKWESELQEVFQHVAGHAHAI
jgi:hypothetical protein